MRECNKEILNVINLSTKLLFYADQGDLKRCDDSCGVLFGIVRDSAYTLLDLARKERELHIREGIWDPGRDSQLGDES